MFFNVKNKNFIYLLLFPSSSILLGGLALYIVEINTDESSIKNIGDAYWLAMTTVTTVGYGEIYPATLEGRIICGILLLAGVLTIFGFLTTIGAKIIEPTLEVKTKEEKSSRKQQYTNEKSKKSVEPSEKSKQDVYNKEWIKDQIDKLEKLDDNEFGSLVSKLSIYYQKSKKF